MVSGLFSAKTVVHLSTTPATASFEHAVALCTETPALNTSTTALIPRRVCIISPSSVRRITSHQFASIVLAASTQERDAGFRPRACRAPRAATPPHRRQAWLGIFVVGCSLPCDPPGWGSFMQSGIIPRFHRAVVAKADSLSADRMSLQSCSWYVQGHDIM